MSKRPSSQSSNSGGNGYMKKLCRVPSPSVASTRASTTASVQEDDSEEENDESGSKTSPASKVFDVSPAPSIRESSSGNRVTGKTSVASMVATFVCWICSLAKPFKLLSQKTAETMNRQECLICNKAVNALRRAAESQGELQKKKLANQRAMDPKAYRQKVLSLRIAPEGEEPIIDALAGTGGCTNNAERLVKAREIVNRTEAIFSMVNDISFSEFYFCITPNPFKHIAWALIRSYF